MTPAAAIGPRTAIQVDANINRGIKHGFLDMNQAAPIPKDALNAALSANPNAVIRTQGQADATRPITPAPNGFRRMDLLTNEGRFWYEGVRIVLQHRTDPLQINVGYYTDEGKFISTPVGISISRAREISRCTVR